MGSRTGLKGTAFSKQRMKDLQQELLARPRKEENKNKSKRPER